MRRCRVCFVRFFGYDNFFFVRVIHFGHYVLGGEGGGGLSYKS